MQNLYKEIIPTPIGDMLAVANVKSLKFLEFYENETIKKLDKEFENIEFKSNIITQKLKDELDSYFKGNLKNFSIDLDQEGSDFQKRAWNILRTIPYATAISYKDQALLFGNQNGYRAAANANGKNRILILIPCHRVLRSDGSLGGYNSGPERKRWLLNFEKSNIK